MIAALPYDVYSSDEARKEVAGKPLSFLNIDRPETQFDPTVDPYATAVYQKAHDLLWEMVDRGDFIRESEACYYIYELTMNGRVQDGLVVCASIDDYLDGTIKKHENTREEKEQDRIRHVDICGAQTGPIFLAYRANDQIREIIAGAKKEKPLYDFTAEDGIRHRVFRIGDRGQIAFITRCFQEMPALYIADGHHRAASAVKVGLMRRKEHPSYTGTEEFNYFLSVLFADEQLMILDYNRVVKDLNGYTQEAFLSEMKKRFHVTKIEAEEDVGQQEDPRILEQQKAFEQSGQREDPRRPRKKGEFTMFLGDCWYRCAFHGEDMNHDPVEGLDVSLLQKLLLTPVLGIADPRTDGRIDFVGGIRGLSELERRVHTDCAVAFAMFPTSIAELFAVADAGLLMPPKSTWFEPKLRSGLFIHEID